MKYCHNIVISLALVFLILLVPSIGFVAAQQSDGGLHWMTWAPLNEVGAPKIFNATWYGTSLRTEGSIEFWELELVPVPGMMMETDGGLPMTMMGETWVTMTLMWDPIAGKGQVTAFNHYGNDLFFTGWGGTIENPVYHFWFGGHGVGTFNDSGTLYPCDIWGGFEGMYYPYNSTYPFMIGPCGFSNFTELATLRWGIPPVGGEIIPVNKMAVFSPYFTLLVLVAAASVTAAFAVRRRLFY